MEKLEIKINDEYKVIPNEMTLSMYQQIMLNPELYDNNSLQVMSLYTGIPTNELKDLKSDEIQVIDYLISQRIKIKDTNELALTFIYNNVEYGLENDWSKLSWGAWMDFEVYSTENIYSNLHKIMAILYRPLIKKGTFNVKKYKIVPYKSEEIEDRAEIMKDVPLSYWLGAAQFFFSTASMSIKSMAVSLAWENRINKKILKGWTMLPKFLQRKLPLDSILISRINSQKKTLQKLTKS